MPTVPVSRDRIASYAEDFFSHVNGNATGLPDWHFSAWQCTNLIENAVWYPETHHLAPRLYAVMGALTGLCSLNRRRAAEALSRIGVPAGEP